MAQSATQERALRTKEIRLRRLAQDQGLGLVERTTRDAELDDDDRWLVTDPVYGWVVTCQPNLDQVEAFLRSTGGADPKL